MTQCAHAKLRLRALCFRFSFFSVFFSFFSVFFSFFQKKFKTSVPERMSSSEPQVTIEQLKPHIISYVSNNEGYVFSHGLLLLTTFRSSWKLLRGHLEEKFSLTRESPYCVYHFFSEESQPLEG